MATLSVTKEINMNTEYFPATSACFFQKKHGVACTLNVLTILVSYLPLPSNTFYTFIYYTLNLKSKSPYCTLVIEVETVVL
jgi:hypothetical protein